MGCAAEVISLADVRASRQHQALRQELHERFDQWLDQVEGQLPDAKLTLAQVSETLVGWRQALIAGVAQTLVDHHSQDELWRTHLHGETCQRPLKARPAVPRTVETRGGRLHSSARIALVVLAIGAVSPSTTCGR
jgi:hypothetical protein